MKRQTNLQKKLDWSDTLKCLRTGQHPHRLEERRRDGSLPTKPTISIPNPKPESEVLKDCLLYLRRKRYQADRQNNGKFFTNGEWHTYGIIGSGDIIAISPDGLHVEVECKKGTGGEWRVEQQRRCKRVRDHKGLYLLVHDVSELNYFLETGYDSRSTDGQGCDEDAAQEDDEGFDQIVGRGCGGK